MIKAPFVFNLPTSTPSACQSRAARTDGVHPLLSTPLLSCCLRVSWLCVCVCADVCADVCVGHKSWQMSCLTEACRYYLMTVLCEVTADTTTSNWTAACQTVVFVILTVGDELQLDGCGFRCTRAEHETSWRLLDQYVFNGFCTKERI